MHPVLFIVFLPLLAAIIAGLGGRAIGQTASKLVTTGALMIGAVLIADGFGVHVPKGYIYAAMAFSAGVEALNMLARRKRPTVEDKTLH